MTTFYLEGPGGIPGLKQSPSAYTKKLFNFQGGANFSAGTVNFTGAAVTGLTSGVEGIVATNAAAFYVGQTAANPALNVDTHIASSATGISVVSAAAASGVTLQVISSATNEGMTLATKGTGGIFINTGYIVETVASGNALAIGPNGSANPTFNVDSSVSSAATGLNIQGKAAGSGLAVTTLSSASAENLTVAAKGTTGTITFNPAIVASAGGSAADGIMYGSIGVGLFTGTGAPSFSAMNGSIYTDSNATTTTTRIYVNKSGAGTAGTTWTALTTAA